MSIIKGIKVGTTDITSQYSSKSDTKSLEVTAVSLESISKPGNTTYTGSPIKVKPVLTNTFNGTEVELVEGIDYELSYSNNTNVGTATVTATGKGNYKGTLSETWQITGADFTVTANDQSFEYDGKYHGTGITVSGVGSVTPVVMYGRNIGVYDSDTIPQIRNVVDSGTVYFKVSAQNHNDYVGTYELNIGPKTAVLEWGQLTWTYDGNEHRTTCVVSNLIAGDSCTVTLHGNQIIAIGTKTVTARASDSLSNPNYVLLEDESRTLEIKPGLFVRLVNEWIPVKKVFKMVSGVWVQQDPMNAFSTSARYVKVD